MPSSRATKSGRLAKRSMILVPWIWLIVSALAIAWPAEAQTLPGQLRLEALQRDELAPPMPRERVRESGIKSVAAWRYPVGADGTEGEGTQVLFIEYDRRGYVALRTGPGQDVMSLSRPEPRYDSEGRIAEAEYPPGELADISKMTFHYDDEGRLAQSVSYLRDGTRGPAVKYEYDASGRPVKVSTVTFEGYVLNGVTLEYEPDGNISRIVVQGPGGESTLSTTVLAHGASGRPTEQVTADDEGRVLARTTYTYNAAGNPTEVAAFNGEGRVVSLLSYSYDERGNITQIVQAYPAARLRTRTDLRYDADGNLLEQVLYNKLDRPVEIIRYVYDHYSDR